MKNSWDVIIVGAGSAGCVLANKLSEDPRRSVLLIEAGPKDNHLFINMPAGVANAIASPKFNWHYWTSPQQHLDGRELTTPRGKVLGGSSSINALVYMRGQAEDFDDWQAAGCHGWSYQDVLPFFKECETNVLGENDYHGAQGPLFVGNPESKNPMFDAFINAGVEMGFSKNDDFNGASQSGFGPFQLNIKNGRRCSSATAFLNPARRRKNLTVVTHAQVLKVNFLGKRAVGVTCQIQGKVQTLRSGKTILSGGAIGSPHILLLSGIGPKQDLNKHNIRCVIDLPGVGGNLHDHLEVKVKCRINQPLSLAKYQSIFPKLLAGASYLLTRRGVCRQQGLEAGAFINLAQYYNGEQGPSGAHSRPDTQLHFINALAFDGAKPEDRGHGFAIDVTPLRPESRGHIKLASSNPLESPIIDPNYLATESDRKMIRDGLRFLRELVDQSSLKSYIDTELFPGVDIQSDEQLDQVIRQTAESIYHPVGTAKMGTDDHSVVDPYSMEVHGLKELYVADASIMPNILSGNTNAASIMIGAKASQLIDKHN